MEAAGAQPSRHKRGGEPAPKPSLAFAIIAWFMIAMAAAAAFLIAVLFFIALFVAVASLAQAESCRYFCEGGSVVAACDNGSYAVRVTGICGNMVCAMAGSNGIPGRAGGRCQAVAPTVA